MAPLKFVAVVTLIALICMPWKTQAGHRHASGQPTRRQAGPSTNFFEGGQGPTRTEAGLSTNFYETSCLPLQEIVRIKFEEALSKDPRIGASLLRVHFHDCFVQGCDGSVLLADTADFTGEQSAIPNLSLRGFDVVDDIKAEVEKICPNTVSCADLLALIALYGVVAARGPSWPVFFGRRDSTTACLSCANGGQLPAPFSNVTALTSNFAAKGLGQRDMVALSGAHTFGKAHCGAFSNRLYPTVDPTLNPGYAGTLQGECPSSEGTVPPNVVVNLDQTTPATFDNAYYHNLLSKLGLLTSDEALQTDGGATADVVREFAFLQDNFFNQFAESIIKMGNISPLTGTEGQIRQKCSIVNS